MAMQCDNGDAALAEKACAAEELKFYKSQVDPADRTVLQRTTAEDLDASSQTWQGHVEIVSIKKMACYCAENTHGLAISVISNLGSRPFPIPSSTAKNGESIRNNEPITVCYNHVSLHLKLSDLRKL